MNGTVRVYKKYTNELILEESNMIMDGFKEHVVDMMTRIPAPSSIEASVSASYKANNFGVQALSFSPNRSNFSRVHSLAAASGNVIDGNNAPLSGLDPLDGYAWSYLNDITNSSFSSVNRNTSPTTNSVVSNTHFSSTTGFLRNTGFEKFALDTSLSGADLNERLDLYQLPNWNIVSELRYNPQNSVFDNSYRLGSCSRLDFSAGPLTLKNATSSLNYDDSKGVVKIRSFSPSATNFPSGAVSLDQRFRLISTDYTPPSNAENLVAEITAKFYTLYADASAQVLIHLEDVSKGDFYNFEHGSSYTRHTWEGSGTPYEVVASGTTLDLVSKFVNIPQDRRLDLFRLRLEFFTGSNTGYLETYLTDVDVKIIDDWSVGNIHTNGDLKTFSDNDLTNSGLFIALSGEGVSPSGTELSNVTYVAQKVNMKPLKSYVFNVFPEYLSGLSQNDDFRTAIVKKSSSTRTDPGQYNYLTQITASSLNETRLLEVPYAITPELSRKSNPAPKDAARRDAKPSDLCLEVSSARTGTFVVHPSNRFRLKGSVIKKFENGLEGSDARIRVRSVQPDSAGRSRYFNFITNAWELEQSVFTTANISFEGSVLDFETQEVNVGLLAGHGVASDASGLFDIEVRVVSSSSNPLFIKNLKATGTPPVNRPEIIEIFDSNATTPQTMWTSVDYSGQYIFSGLGNDTLMPVKPDPNPSYNQTGLMGVQGMFAAPDSIHEDKSEYEVFILQSEDNVAGEFIKLQSVSLVDAALITCTEEVADDIMTSEAYSNAPRFDILNQPYVKFVDSPSEVYPTTLFTRPSFSPFNSPGGGSTLLPGEDNALVISRLTGAVPSTATASLNYTYALSDINIPPRTEGIAFGVSFSVIFGSLKWKASATSRTGEVVWWDGSGWKYFAPNEEPSNEFALSAVRITGTNATKLKETRTPVIDIVDAPFDDSTKINFEIFVDGFSSAALMYLRDWRFYLVTESAQLDLPEFPTPEDTTVQTPESPAAELGQYTNHLQFSSVDERRALGECNWGPASSVKALYVSGDAIDSQANNYNVVDQEGFVHYGFSGYDSDGNITAGWMLSATSSSLIYMLDIVDKDLDYFEHQGGIGAMGLWTFDVNQTYRKLLDNGHSLSAIYDKGETPNLYNFSDTTRAPVFKLAAKKAFTTPLRYNTSSPSGIRILWEINFL